MHRIFKGKTQLRVFPNRVLRSIFGPQEEARETRIVRIFINCAAHLLLRTVTRVVQS